MDSNYTPLPIYKRPKDDDEELEESSLKPHQYLSSKTHLMPKGAVPDLKLFENMEVIEKCKGFGIAKGDDDEIESEEQTLILCPALKRLVAVLNYYNSLMMNVVDGDEIFLQNQFIEFCDKYYGQNWMLEDYMHFISNHSDLESTTIIAASLEYRCFGDLKRCAGTARHYRNRQRDDKENVHFYVNIMDSMHFNVLHLVDVGLRVDIDWNLEEQEIEGLVNQKVLKMNREIQLKRQQNAFARIDGTAKNSKFSLCSTVESNGGAKGGLTKMDLVLKGFKKAVGDEAAVHRLVEFMEEQRYDTETMNEDMVVYEEAKQCNVFNVIKKYTDTLKSTNHSIWKTASDSSLFGKKNDVPVQKMDPYSLFDPIRRLLRYHRVSGSSFATGIWWVYWSWYKTQTVDSLMHYTYTVNDKRLSGLWNDIEFGGHSLKCLFVEPHFQNLKEEALASGLITAEFWTTLSQKARRYLDSSRCKHMIDSNSRAYRLGFIRADQKFKVMVHHLVALLLYTDSSEYCTALSKTYRAIKSAKFELVF